MLKSLKLKAVALIIAALNLFLCFGCTLSDLYSRTEGLNLPSVNFLSVGQGDCAFIIFPDGKTMLIDCGEKSDENFAVISKFVDAGGKSIDYLVLTHPDSDHVGGAADVIKKYGVRTAYIPDIRDLTPYPAFSEAKSALISCGARLNVSATGLRIVGENYLFCFLHPDDEGYGDVNFGEPNSDDVNAISAVTFLNYRGVKFVFTGDATKSAELEVVNKGNAGLYSLFGTNEMPVSLSEVDFLKVSHHGAKEEICEELYAYLVPKNAVISVGANNRYGHPSVYTLTALQTLVENVNVLRTDVLGSISVYIESDGRYNVVTDVD